MVLDQTGAFVEAGQVCMGAVDQRYGEEPGFADILTGRQPIENAKMH